MRNFKRITGFMFMCIMVIMMAATALASNSGTGQTDRSSTAGTESENGTAGTESENGNGANSTAGTETAGGEISSFNNYGENGNYEALGEYEVAYGADISEVTSKLPSTLTAKLTSGEEVEVPVTWICVNDGVGGTAYVPEHQDASAVYTFEAQLSEGYTMANNVADDFVMPFATVSYTEDAQMLNSSAESDADTAVDDAGGMSGWSWIIWIIVIVIIVVILWWIFAGNKGGSDKGRDNHVN